jgi:hypothetical protein
MSFLQNNTDFNYDNNKLKLIFNNRIIYDDKMKNPMIFKVEYSNDEITNIEEIDK